jgi:hypothetical protein
VPFRTMDRALLDSPPKLTPPAKLAGTRLASDENNPTLPTMRPSRRWGTRFWGSWAGPKVAAISSVRGSCRLLKLSLRDYPAAVLWDCAALPISSGSHTLLPLRGSPSIHRLN